MNAAAVVAHFDADDRLDQAFREVLHCVSQVCRHVLLVTTSRLRDEDVADLPVVSLVRRPNLGYDFFSYRAGLSRLIDSPDLEAVLLVNSSFLLADRERFLTTLRAMLAATTKADVVSLTESEQIHWHLQSYLLAFSGQAVRSDWFRQFFEAIRPLNSKLELILAYELGLSRLIKERAVPATALFKAQPLERLQASVSWLRVLARQHGGSFWFGGEALRNWGRFNPVQFAAQPLARRHGVVKWELLRSNPHEFDVAKIRKLLPAETRLAVEESVVRTRAGYRSDGKGLTVRTEQVTGIDPNRVLAHGPSRSTARVAVALHLYYPEMLGEILGYLAGIIEPFDLFITTPFEGDAPPMLDAAASLAARTTVCIVENRGRDIRPFLLLLQSGWLDRYRAVLKIHGKKSTYSDRGEQWRREIYGDLMGTSLTIRRSLALFDDPAVGMVGSWRFFVSNPLFWGANEARVARIMRATGLVPDDHAPLLAFYAGSMFWFRPPALAPLARLPKEELCFEDEAGQQDGTLAHAIERSFALIAHRSGYRGTAIPLAGGDILSWDSTDHRVTVL
jgi:lipopolysaccharide biosynthesis protein